MGRKWVAAAVALTLVVVVGGCKTDADSEPTTVTRTGPRASLQFRPVVAVVDATTTPPGPSVLNSARENGPRYEVGDVALTQRGVSAAVARNTPGLGWAVDLTLNRIGTHAFNELAAELYPKSPPQNSVAIVVNGAVESAPAFMTNSFEGGQVQISGNYTEKQAQTLAASLRP